MCLGSGTQRSKGSWLGRALFCFDYWTSKSILRGLPICTWSQRQGCLSGELLFSSACCCIEHAGRYFVGPGLQTIARQIEKASKCLLMLLGCLVNPRITSWTLTTGGNAAAWQLYTQYTTAVIPDGSSFAQSHHLEQQKRLNDLILTSSCQHAPGHTHFWNVLPSVPVEPARVCSPAAVEQS